MSRFNYIALAQDLSVLVGRPVTETEARAVKRDIQRHQSLQEAACNYTLSWRQQCNQVGVEARLSKFFGRHLVGFSGDPRGATVKLVDPQSTYNPVGVRMSFVYFSRDWGGNLIFTGYRR